MTTRASQATFQATFQATSQATHGIDSSMTPTFTLKMHTYNCHFLLLFSSLISDHIPHLRWLSSLLAAYQEVYKF